MDDGSWALAVSLGHVRNAVVAFVAAEDPSGESLCGSPRNVEGFSMRHPEQEPRILHN